MVEKKIGREKEREKWAGINLNYLLFFFTVCNSNVCNYIIMYLVVGALGAILEKR